MEKNVIFAVLIFAVIIVVSYLVAREFYKAAVMKGWAARKYFWLPFLLGIVGYLLIIALPDRGGSHMSVLVSDDLPEI